ncbi:hypothetical protein HAX54_045770 [Datura stramonium]|uniref:Uncharacterized protein n=1 Tax=Datura stramonium TaxID=4076 RepID=A0ABS8WI79_DATST|nr:hypothetical protein [Datura stramonium]
MPVLKRKSLPCRTREAEADIKGEEVGVSTAERWRHSEKRRSGMSSENSELGFQAITSIGTMETPVLTDGRGYGAGGGT